PESPTDFGPFLTNGPPTDPFTSEPLKAIITPDAFVCYSVGPDRHDDHAAIAFSPNYGSTSAGDIIATVTLTREFPFPDKPIAVNSGAELRAMFPNGLPLDIFADKPGTRLSITEDPPV